MKIQRWGRVRNNKESQVKQHITEQEEEVILDNQGLEHQGRANSQEEKSETTTLHYTTLHYTTLHYTTLHVTTSAKSLQSVQVEELLPLLTFGTEEDFSAKDAPVEVEPAPSDVRKHSKSDVQIQKCEEDLIHA